MPLAGIFKIQICGFFSKTDPKSPLRRLSIAVVHLTEEMKCSHIRQGRILNGMACGSAVGTAAGHDVD
jgi:hypothetical protein